MPLTDDIRNAASAAASAVAEAAKATGEAIVEYGPTVFWYAVDATPFIFDRSETRIKETFSSAAKAKALEELGSQGKAKHVESQDLACLTAIGNYEKERIKDLGGFVNFRDQDDNPITLPNGLSLTAHLNKIKPKHIENFQKSFITPFFASKLNTAANELKTCQEDLEYLNRVMKSKGQPFSAADYACALTDIQTRTIKALEERHRAEEQGLHELFNPNLVAGMDLATQAERKKYLIEKVFGVKDEAELAKVEASFVSALKEQQDKEKAALEEAFAKKAAALYEETNNYAARLGYLAAMAKTDTPMGREIKKQLADGVSIDAIDLKTLVDPTQKLDTSNGLKITYDGKTFSLHLSKFSDKGDQEALRNLAEARCATLKPDDEITFTVRYTTNPLRAQELARIYIEELAALGIDPQATLTGPDGKPSSRLKININGTPVENIKSLFSGPHENRWSALVTKAGLAQKENENQANSQQGRGNAASVQGIKDEIGRLRLEKAKEPHINMAKAELAKAQKAQADAEAALGKLNLATDPTEFPLAEMAVNRAKSEVVAAKAATDATVAATTPAGAETQAKLVEAAAARAEVAKGEADHQLWLAEGRKAAPPAPPLPGLGGGGVPPI